MIAPATPSDMVSGVAPRKYLSMCLPSSASSSSCVSAAAILVMTFLSIEMMALVNGLVMTLRMSGGFSPDVRASGRSAPETSYRYPVAASIGRRTRTERKLNMSWTVAAAKARRNSSRSVDCASATIVEVTDVPMLAPMMSEMACLTVKRSAATMVMTIEVEVEDDWTRTVTRTPTSMPAIGLLKISELRKSWPAWRPATRRKPLARNESEQMKR